jgi:hypothetical protein
VGVEEVPHFLLLCDRMVTHHRMNRSIPAEVPTPISISAPVLRSSDGLDLGKEASGESVLVAVGVRTALAEVEIDRVDGVLLGAVLEVSKAVATVCCAGMVLVVDCAFTVVPELPDAEILKDPELMKLWVAISWLRTSSKVRHLAGLRYSL